MSRDRFLRTVLFAAVLVASSAGSIAFGQSLDSPSTKAGDTWTYRTTSEKGPAGSTQSHQEIVVSHITSSSIYYTSHEVGSTQKPIEFISPTDWSRVRNVDGAETVVNKPFSFPLYPGKTWEIAYTESQPNKRGQSEQRKSKHTVVGFEPVEVPAGKFNALKIEAEGRWTIETEPAAIVAQGAHAATVQSKATVPSTATGRFYKAFWYVPEVKRWVKSIEEYFSSGGDRNESYTGELESFKVTN
jgi:hypothetical protein